MAIVFSAIVPHSPVLIPSVGKENLKRIESTKKAFKKIEEDLYSSKVETIIIISPHGTIQQDAFSMNLAPNFSINFEEFGDFTSKLEITGNVGLAHKIKEGLETSAPLQLINEGKLDHGSSIPLYLLTQNMPNVKVIPIYYSGLDLESHFSFGKLLKQELMSSKERIAVIASGDLSHKLSKDSPAGYSSKGKKFDKKLIEYLSKHKTKEIINLKHESIVEVGECGLKSIVILLGILNDINYEPQILSYESPFGVGYLTMNLKL